MTRADRILILGLITVAVLCVPLVTWAAPSDRVTISGPQGVTGVDPDKDATYAVAGRLGTVEVRVQAGRIRVRESCCADALCVRAGVLAPGKPLVCAPNGVVISYGSAPGEEALDAVSR